MTQVEQDFKEERRRRKELSISLCDSSEDSGVISLFQLALPWLQTLCMLHSNTIQVFDFHRLQFIYAGARQGRKERPERREEKVKVGGAGEEVQGDGEGGKTRQAEGIGQDFGRYLEV